MEFQFDCSCGEQISDFTRSNNSSTDFQIECDDCNAWYTVTITQIREGTNTK